MVDEIETSSEEIRRKPNVDVLLWQHSPSNERGRLIIGNKIRSWLENPQNKERRLGIIIEDGVITEERARQFNHYVNLHSIPPILGHLLTLTSNRNTQENFYTSYFADPEEFRKMVISSQLAYPLMQTIDEIWWAEYTAAVGPDIAETPEIRPRLAIHFEATHERSSRKKEYQQREQQKALNQITALPERVTLGLRFKKAVHIFEKAITGVERSAFERERNINQQVVQALDPLWPDYVDDVMVILGEGHVHVRDGFQKDDIHTKTHYIEAKPGEVFYKSLVSIVVTEVRRRKASQGRLSFRDWQELTAYFLFSRLLDVVSQVSENPGLEMRKDMAYRQQAAALFGSNDGTLFKRMDKIGFLSAVYEMLDEAGNVE